MNYTRRGVRKQEQEILGLTERLYRKLSVMIFVIAIVAMVAVITIVGALGIGAFRGMLVSAPDISGMNVTPRGYSTFVYDIEGNQIAKLVSADSNRIPVTWEMVPKHMKDAFVAIEDERFYSHNGIDIYGIIRAFFEGVASGEFSQGASTITQQLLKNSVFTDWIGQEGVAKYRRKVQEQFLAVQLEKTMSKDDILLNYMNTVNLGQNTLGVQAASLRYFGKSVSELTLSEAACIAGITQNPAGYNPISHPEANEQRRERVLRKMLALEMISEAEYQEAMNDDVYSRIQVVNKEQEGSDITSYFVDALTVALLEDLMALGYTESQAYTLMYSSGLKIYSTQDPRIQKIADDIFADPANFPPYTQILLSYALTIEKADGTLENHSQEMLESYFKQFNAYYTRLYGTEEEAYAAVEEYKAAVMEEGDAVFDERITLTLQPQASLTIMDQRTGYVIAMVGGRGQKTASRTLNRATDTTRQPGSCFKVVSTFAPALDAADFTLASTVNDAPFAYENGRLVRNHWGAEYRGMYTVRNAIRDSANVVTVKTLTWITPQLGFDYLQKYGFTTLVASEQIGTQTYTDIQQSLALGGVTHGVTNVELNAAYAAMANGGVYCKPVYYTKVVDAQGNVLIDHTQPETHRVLKETTAWLMTSAMQDVVMHGTGGLASIGTTAVAGKTGTTTDNKDVWFSGYTDYYTATTWVGFDNNQELSNTTVASTLWAKVMSEVHAGLPWRDFTQPPGLTQATVCAISGKLPVPGLCDATLNTEWFEEGTVPTDPCDQHIAGDICMMTSREANTHCPFRQAGASWLPPVEPEAVAKGTRAAAGQAADESAMQMVVDENGNETMVRAKCIHDEAFWSRPDAEQVLHDQTLAFCTTAGFPADQAEAVATGFARACMDTWHNHHTVGNFFQAEAAAQQQQQQPEGGGDGN